MLRNLDFMVKLTGSRLRIDRKIDVILFALQGKNVNMSDEVTKASVCSIPWLLVKMHMPGFKSNPIQIRISVSLA